MTRAERRLYRTIGQNVWQARIRAGMSQERLADEMGMARTSIVNLEAGKQFVPLVKLYQIADILDVTLRQLVPPAL